MDIKELFENLKPELTSIRISEVVVDVLRLDQIHPIISGNKWYKLKYNLQKAAAQNCEQIISFGGAYSNHLHALAFAGHLMNIKTKGFVRGEPVNNPTLTDCKTWGMDVEFLNRAEYEQKDTTRFLGQLENDYPNAFVIPEGGDNNDGLIGCREILEHLDTSSYDLVCVPLGRGTTFLGLLSSTKTVVCAFSSFRSDRTMEHLIKFQDSFKHASINYDYQFGGFGQYNDQLLEFMQSFKQEHQIALDMVYTAKMFFGIQDLLSSGSWANKKLLAIHTGGLQGNRSLDLGL